MPRSFVDRTSNLVLKDLQVRNPHATSFLETLAHVLKGNLGAGLFAMGDAFMNSGLIFGFFITIFIGSVCIYNNHLLVRLSRHVRYLKNLTLNPTFPETITYSFELGPPKFSRISPIIFRAMKSFIVITQLGFCVIYITIVAESMLKMGKEQWGFEWDVRYYMLSTIPIILLVSLVHTLKFLAPISAISTIFLVYGCAVSIGICIKDIPPIESRRLISPVAQWPLFIGTVIFAFEGIALVIPLKNEMKESHKFDITCGVLNIGMSIVMSLYLIMGVVSYWKYGDDISGSVTFDLPGTPLAESARFTVALGILLTFPIQFYVPVKIFMRELRNRYGPLKRPLIYELALRTGLVLIVYIFSLTIPHVNLLLSLIGAVCSNALALLLPALADISLRCRPALDDGSKQEEVDEGEKPFTKDKLRFTIDGISIVLSIIAMIFGAYIALRDIIAALRKDMGFVSEE